MLTFLNGSKYVNEKLSYVNSLKYLGIKVALLKWKHKPI